MKLAKLSIWKRMVAMTANVFGLGEVAEPKVKLKNKC